jgi:fucose permease
VKRPRLGLLLLVLSYAGFVAIGLPDGLLGVAAPGMRASFGVGLDALGELLLAFMVGYLASSVASGWAMQRLGGPGGLLAWSCGVTAASLFGYALAPSWLGLVACGPLAGLGAGAIDAGLNTVAARTFSARTITWLHASYGVGATAGPALMTAVLESGGSWRLGYALVAATQLALAWAFGVTCRGWPAGHSAGDRLEDAPPLRSTLRLPAAWLGIAVFLLYTGIEAGAGVWAYSLLTEARGMAPPLAGACVSAYWASFAAARVAAGAIVNRVGPSAMLRASTAGIPLAAALLWLAPQPAVSALGLVLLGVACAPVYPALMATTPRRVGDAHTAGAVGLQVAGATLGQQILPALLGVLAARHGLEVVAPALLAVGVALWAGTLLREGVPVRSDRMPAPGVPARDGRRRSSLDAGDAVR